MELKKFQEHLKENNIDERQIVSAVKLVQDFRKFISKIDKSLQNANYEDLYEFSRKMIEKMINTYDNYVYILRYARFMQNNELTIATMEIIDGAEMMNNFSERLERKHGKLVRDTVFRKIGIPPLGIHPKERPVITMKLIERLIENVGHDEAKTFLNTGLRDRYSDWYKIARETYLDAGNIDKFLEIKRQKFQQTLKKHRDEGSLFFTQIIDDEVLDYVSRNPAIESGTRDGKILSVYKIPYMTKQFLEAKRNNDTRKMKYYFCHNPWFREGLLQENMEINPIACQISCGYYKDYWEGVLGTAVQVELTGSLVLGDETCKFDVHLSESSTTNK